jgi:hypothetical protein
MSEEHVAAVFGPAWVREARESDRLMLGEFEWRLLAIRHRMRALDLSLPWYFDGPAWHELEVEWEAVRQAELEERRVAASP